MAWTKENMPTFTPDIEGEPAEGLFTPTSDQKHRLGARFCDGHGRKFRYAKNGSVELAAALMTCAEAPNGGLLNQVQTGYTTAIGDDRIRVLVTTANGITDGDLVDGWLVTRNGTGEGYSYPIAGNSWITSDTVLDIQLYDTIRVATAATSEFDLRKNLWSGVIVNATTPTGLPTGVPNQVIAANYYGWVQTGGPCAMTVDAGETLTIGCACGGAAAAATAGAVGVFAATEPFYGQVITISEEYEQALIYLMLE